MKINNDELNILRKIQKEKKNQSKSPFKTIKFESWKSKLLFKRTKKKGAC